MSIIVKNYIPVKYAYIYKKTAPSQVAESKPRASPLHAEMPWNYTLGRLAAAFQNVFASATSLPLFFYNENMNEYGF